MICIISILMRLRVRREGQGGSGPREIRALSRCCEFPRGINTDSTLTIRAYLNYSERDARDRFQSEAGTENGPVVSFRREHETVTETTLDGRNLNMNMNISPCYTHLPG